MRVWVDDIRTPPDATWTWCMTSEHAILILETVKTWHENPIEIMSLDHDLGRLAYSNEEDTTRPVVLWMCENNFWPVSVVVHSANPVGRIWLEGMIERYKDRT